MNGLCVKTALAAEDPLKGIKTLRETGIDVSLLKGLTDHSSATALCGNEASLDSPSVPE